MKSQSKVIFGALAVLLAVGIALWSQKQLPPAPVPTSSASSKPLLTPAVPEPNPKELLASIAQPKPVTPPSTGDQRPFAKMGVLERDAILDEIAKKDLPAIFQAMLDAGRVEHDPRKQSALATTFAGALHERTPTPEFLVQLRKFIEDKSNPSLERDTLVGALAMAATTDTANFFLNLATTSSDKQLRESAAGGLSEIRGATHEDLAPAIEKLWRESNDEIVVTAMSLTMTKVGASSSMELLVSAALAKDGADDMRKHAALNALETATILNDHAVPPLAARLANQSPASVASKMAGATLARISRPTAAQALITWLQDANSSAAPLVHDYLVRTQYAEIWELALDPSVPFRSEANREAIRASLAQLKASYKSGP